MTSTEATSRQQKSIRQLRAKIYGKNKDIQVKQAANYNTPITIKNDESANVDTQSKILMRSNEPIQSLINSISAQQMVKEHLSERPSIATQRGTQTITIPQEQPSLNTT